MKVNKYNIVFLFLFIFKCTINYGQESSITNGQTKMIFNLLFGSRQADDLEITSQDKKKATFFIKELAEKSCELGVAQSLLDVDASLKSIFTSIIESTLKCSDAIKKGKYYEAVRVSLANNFKSEFAIRKATGEW